MKPRIMATGSPCHGRKSARVIHHCHRCFALSHPAIDFKPRRIDGRRWFETPFRYYADRDHPLTSFGFHDFDPSAHPISDLPQKQALYFNDYVPQIIEHTPANVPGQWWRARLRKTLTFGSAFPFPLLLPLLPVGLMAARGRAWVVLSALPLFVALYSFYVFFLPHYPIVIAPAVIVGILLGARAIPELVPRGQKMISAWLSLMIIGAAIASLPQWDRTSNDEMFPASLMAAVAIRN